MVDLDQTEIGSEKSPQNSPPSPIPDSSTEAEYKSCTLIPEELKSPANGPANISTETLDIIELDPIDNSPAPILPSRPPPEISYCSQGPEQGQGQKNVNGKEKTPETCSESWKVFSRRIVADVKNKDLRDIKILYFFKFATLYVLYPFMTLHIKSLGLTSDETGINSAFIPIAAIFGPPVAGVVADKIGNFKLFLAILTFINAGLALLLLLVPVARQQIELPSTILLSLNCSKIQKSHSTSFETPHNEYSFTLRTLEDDYCNVNQTNRLITAVGNEVGNVGPGLNGGEIPLVSNILCKKVCGANLGEERDQILDNFARMNRNVKLKLEEGESLIKPDLNCNGEKSNCFLAFSTPNFGEEFKEISRIEMEKLSLAKNGSKSSEWVPEGKFSLGKNKFEEVPLCSFPLLGIEPTGSGPEKNSSNSCRDACFLSFNRSLFCSNKKYEKVFNVPLTFGLYTFFRILLGLFSATSFIMFEGAVLALLKKHSGDYGIQRIAGVLAGIFVSPLSGALISWSGDFRPAFYFYAILQTISAILTLRIDLTFRKPGQKVLKNLIEVLSNLEILLFFLAVLISGAAWGYLESFLFWFIKDLGGSEFLMGLTISVGGLAGIPILIFSGPIIKYVGYVNVLCIGLFFYAVRLVGYSLIVNPWYCLIFESMESVTASLAMTAAATYAAALSTHQTITSVQGIFGAMYFGIGRGIGSLIGGFLIKSYDHRSTFRIFACGALIGGLLYYIANLVYIRRQTRTRNGVDLYNMNGTPNGMNYKDKEGFPERKLPDLPETYLEIALNEKDDNKEKNKNGKLR